MIQTFLRLAAPFVAVAVKCAASAVVHSKNNDGRGTCNPKPAGLHVQQKGVRPPLA